MPILNTVLMLGYGSRQLLDLVLLGLERGGREGEEGDSSGLSLEYDVHCGFVSALV